MNWSKTGKWLTTIAAALTLAACSSEQGTEETSAEDTSATEGGESSSGSSDFDTSSTINVVSREDGSGTRDAFTEITGVLVEEGEEEVDQTTADATIQSSTGAVLSSVADDTYAVGYISLGSLDDSVKAVNVNGVEATSENVASGEYELARPFNVAYSGELSPAAQDFWNFMFSPEAQAAVEEQGYIQAETQEEYTMDESAEGTITVGGSTSVTPVMEAIVDAYPNENVTIDLISNGSGAGMTGAIDGTNDIGMASRELDEEESSQLTSQPLAMDGIATIVHTDNPTEDLTLDQIRQIFAGEVTTWEEAQQ